MVKHIVRAQKAEDENSKPVDLWCCVLLPEFDIEAVIKDKEEKEFDHGFGARMWVEELPACGELHDWSYKVGDAMPAVLSRHGARASDWKEFLEEVHAIKMSPWLKTYKMPQGPLLFLFVATLAPLIYAARGCNHVGGQLPAICNAVDGLIAASCVVFGLPTLLLYWLMSRPRREYVQKLTAVEEKFKAKFNADNETFVFGLRVWGAAKRMQARVYVFLILDKTKGGEVNASKNPLSVGLLQAHNPQGSSTGATTAAATGAGKAASTGKDMEMGPLLMN
jgi:hypothetical protein